MQREQYELSNCSTVLVAVTVASAFQFSSYSVGVKLHINPSRFLVFCKEDQKLASKFFTVFDFVYSFPRYLFLSTAKKSNFELSAKNYAYVLNVIRAWELGKLREAEQEDMLSYVSESEFELDMVTIIRNISILISLWSKRSCFLCCVKSILS